MPVKKNAMGDIMIEHHLTGCITAPASDYLKTLGLFKIVSSRDIDATIRWENGYCVMQTRMEKNEIFEFLTSKYAPSPIISPWSYNKYQKTVEAIKDSKDQRFDGYQEAIKTMEKVFEKFAKILGVKEISKKDIDKDKLTLAKLCRNYLSDEVVPWLDVVYVVKKDKPKFAPILGTGANDGNHDISDNFVARILELLNPENKSRSTELLESALFGNAVPLSKVNTIGHNPGGSGGPNFGMGFEGHALSNPWNYVLMIEGTMLFAGNIAKKLSTNTDKAIFPFTAATSNVGYHTASEIETDEGSEPETRAEMWFPVWANPCTYGELRHFFNEGRIQLGKRHANTGTEFARAIISLGMTRGISTFQRFCILKRKGKAYLTIDAGMIRVTDEPAVKLLEEIDGWRNMITKKSKEKGASKSLISLVRNMDESIMKFCRYKGKQNLLRVLISIGKLERYVSSRKDFEPLCRLSDRWLTECYDGTPEFRLAASIASIYSPDVGKIRENLENIEFKEGKLKHDQDSISCVWKEETGMLKNMNDVLHRRSIDGNKKNLDGIPIDGYIHARISDVNEFLNGNINEMMGDMILPLSMIEMDSKTKYPWQNTRDEDVFTLPIPEAYITLKLLHPPDKKECIPYTMYVLNMLRAGRINDAYSKASAILQSHGVDLLRYNKINGLPKKTTVANNVKKHLLASMLFPISQHDREKMLEMIQNSRSH